MPTTADPRWHWRGGRPALDFVNTLRERWRGRIETLGTPADLGDWLVAAGVLTGPGGGGSRLAPAVLEEARTLREAIDEATRAVVAGERVPAAAVTTIDDWLVHAGARPQLRLGADGIPLLGERPAADSPRRALGMVALDAAAMLGHPEEAARARICASATCSARFYDRSPAGARRWCSMRACGNAEKARRHRARARVTWPTGGAVPR